MPCLKQQISLNALAHCSVKRSQNKGVAIVVDPVRTISAGKVCLGAFRTYPRGYKPPNEEPSKYQTIPLSKIEDFGVHCKQYYPLDVTYFKSSLDGKLLDWLWNKYWVNTLGSSGLLTNTEYTTGKIHDLSEKLEQAEQSLGRGFVVPGNSETNDKPRIDGTCTWYNGANRKTSIVQQSGGHQYDAVIPPSLDTKTNLSINKH